MPEAIKGLVSKDEQIRQESYWQLDNHIVLQSDLYKAALFVIPFLLEIVSSGWPYGKDLALDLLFEIGNGYAPPETVCRDLEGNLVSLQQACRDAVMSGLNIYIKEVQGRNSKLRETALELIASFEEMSNIIIEELDTILLEEKDPRFSLKLQQAIDELKS